MKSVTAPHFFIHTTATAAIATFNVSVFNVLYFFSQRKMNGLLTML